MFTTSIASSKFKTKSKSESFGVSKLLGLWELKFGIKLLDEQPFNPQQGFVPPLSVKFGAKSLGFERIFRTSQPERFLLKTLLIKKKF